jgi:surface antigen
MKYLIVGVVIACILAMALPVTLLLLVVGGMGGGGGGLGDLFGGGGESATQLAKQDIPADLLPVYEAAAQTCPGLSWTVLAGIGKVESDHGRSTLPGVHSGQNFAGAKGPMQFLQDTWNAFATAAPGHALADIYNAADAIYTAARYLCSNGAGDPNRLRDAIWHYNHSWDYVNTVLSWAAKYGSSAVQWVVNGVVKVVADVTQTSTFGVLISAGPPYTPVFAGIPPQGVNRSGAAGNCTWWASFNVLAPSHWMGDGGAWVWWYKSHGYQVVEYIPEVDGNATGPAMTGTRPLPPVGSVVSWLRPYDRHWNAGHVAVVIADDPAGGQFEISEMNYKGLGEVDQRTVSVHDPMLYGFVPPDQLAIAAQHPTD